jgi:transposase
MKAHDKIEGQLTVGLDVGDKYTHACVLDADGEILEEIRLSTNARALRHRFEGKEQHRVVLEAGVHSPWISRLLVEIGHEVYVANPRRVRAIYENENKCDRVDAQYLARIGRLDPALLFPLSHRTAQAQADLAILRSRAALVRTRSSLIRFVRGVVKSSGGRIPACDARNFARKAELHLPPELQPALSLIIATIVDMDARVGEYDKEIESVAGERYPETNLLRQVAGVGPITAATFVLTVEDPARFNNCRSIGSYLGLRPRRDESGSINRQLRITKAGDGALRSLLVSCSQYILGHFGPDSDLRRWGLHLAERGGKNGKKRAVVAVARKLSVLLLRLWITGEIYEPLRNARLRGTLQTT